MYTTTSENGILNNYALEPRMYYATYPSFIEQRRYLRQGIVALTFISTLILTAVVIS